VLQLTRGAFVQTFACLACAVCRDPSLHSRGRLTVPPELRKTLDYLEDRVSQLGRSMDKLFEQINTRRDGLISKQELLWLLNSFQLQVSIAAFERLWRHLDSRNAGLICFADFIHLLDKAHTSRPPHLLESADLRTQVRLPAVADHRSRPSGAAGISAIELAQRDAARTFELGSTWRGGRGGVPTLVQNFGDAHLSSGFDRATRYVNQWPLHSGQTKSVLPEKVPHDAFKMDLTSKHPDNEQKFCDAMADHYRKNRSDPRIGNPCTFSLCHLPCRQDRCLTRLLVKNATGRS